MPKGWLKDLDLIQIKAALWQGDSPMSISRQFLITQSTVSAIKHGRLHPEAKWPDGDTGPIPAYRETELLRKKRMGMLRNSEITTRRGHIKNPELRMPLFDEPPISEKEQWFRKARYAEKDDAGTKYTQDELETMWLVEEQERKDTKDAKERERLEREAQADKLRTDAERDYVEETSEERAEEVERQKQAYALSHLWKPRGGGLIVENLITANLSDDEIMGLVATDSRARKGKVQLEEFIEARRMAITQCPASETPNDESPTKDTKQ